MTNNLPITVGSFRDSPKTLRPADSTGCAIGWLAGINGSRIHAINVVSSDGSNAVSLIRYIGKPMTLQSNMGTGQYATTTTITRSSGSFITDGWLVGDKCIPIGSTTRANDKTLTITAVAAGTLTFSETVSTETFPAGLILYKAARITMSNIPISAGYSTSVSSVDCLKDNDATRDASPNRYMTIGALGALIFAANSAIAASQSVEITCQGGDY